MLKRTLPAAVLCLSLLAAACGAKGSKPATQDGISITPVGPAALNGSSATTAPAGTPGPTPTLVPGAALTPHPGVVADIATARRQESEGDIAAASQTYVAVAAKSGPDMTEATEGAARTLLAQDDATDARLLLEPWLATPAGKLDAPAHYLLARAYSALSLWDQSLQQYDAYIATGRPALPYAYLNRNTVLLQLNRPEDAAASVLSGLALGVPDTEKRAFLLAQAQDNERVGNLTAALAGYQALLNASKLAGDDALSLSRIEAIKRIQNDPTYADTQQQLLTGYPSSDQALTELKAAIARGDIIAPTTKGIIYYRHNDYSDAEPFFQAQLSDSPDDKASAEAQYYEAAILEDRGKTDDAADGYAKAVQLNPQSSVADDALWWRGRILEDENKLDQAGALFEQLLHDYPTSTFAPDAAFERGLLPYRAGRFPDAALAWSNALPQVTDATQKQRLTLWQGKALLKAGDKTGAAAALQPLAASGQLDYFGIRAAALLAGKTSEPKATRESNVNLTATQDWSAAEAWLALKAGRPVSDAGWSTDQRWQRANELWRVGRDTEGNAEAFDLMDADAKDPIAMYTMSRALMAQGKVSLSARAGQRLLRVLQTNPNAGLPKALLSLSYPPAFGSLAQQRAQAAGISPLLLLAFVRQESFFDPRAQAPDGGLGLTQVQPDTAESIAKKLGVADFDDDDLLAADESLRFGASYMADQLKSFDSEVFVAFGAYNAGPDAAGRWRKAAGDDPDLFLETVEYSVTKLYVQFVGENYAIYRYLYGGSSTPDWP